jgi:branched-chain amino acid transport system substrate-binding protein
MDASTLVRAKFVSSFVVKYKREPAFFAAYGYDSIKLIDSALRAVAGKIEDKDAVRAALQKADFQSVRSKFKFNNNHYPVEDLYVMQVKKDGNGYVKDEFKAIAVKDWQDPYHQDCPMK